MDEEMVFAQMIDCNSVSIYLFFILPDFGESNRIIAFSSKDTHMSLYRESVFFPQGIKVTLKLLEIFILRGS
jgi:hypothetical protein